MVSLNMKNKKILVVDDDESLRRVIEYNISEEGYEVLSVSNGKEAMAIFSKEDIALVITDLQMPELGGIELIRQLRAVSPNAMVIVITAFGTVDTAVESMKLGAFEYITKPFNREELKMVVKKALEVGDLVVENRYLREMVQEKYSFENMVGSSPKMEEVYRLSSQVAKSDATVLILGESGTGKELLAKGIHFNSLRKEQPFVTINCGSLPENLIESELFGHKKGAFTGAVSDKKGKFELADGGTIFLDEIGELPLHLQVKLLRVLQDGMVDKVGESLPVKVDVRIIAATNRDLEEEVAGGNFREDLYYRLCVVPIKLPPLRERLDDIPLLTEHFLKKYSEKSRVDRVRINKEAIKILLNYSWPGNVRELENLAERTVVMSQTGLVTIDDLPEKLIANSSNGGSSIVSLPDEGINLESLEKELIEKAYAKCKYNQSKAARFLGITRNTLLYRFEKYGIEKR
ncbi:MAG: sigma-54-dependent Fis family transcriptional regulator [Proteobacteria bacterium]|nr:sigma-54-dependent Fis family transcriptional regulator [Pseudomonadota bacterium]